MGVIDEARRRDWDAIVVGLGGIGSGAAYWLSTRLGNRVLGLEQFELGHPNGASQDHSRIIRYSYHRPDYVRLAKLDGAVELACDLVEHRKLVVAPLQILFSPGVQPRQRRLSRISTSG